MDKMEKWARSRYQPCLPLGNNKSKITGSEEHIELSRKAAGEGIVMLKNNNDVLPLKKGTKVAVFGKAQIDYVKCGGGSGYVYCEYVRNIYDGLKQKNDRIEIFDSLSLYYKDYVENEYKKGVINGKLSEIEIPEALLKESKAFTDTAIITINRYSTEDEDRDNDGNDAYFTLSDEEKSMVKTVCDNFKNIIVLLNTGAMIDTSWFSNNDKISSALIIWQGGMEGGLATADVLVGDVNPSGKLVDTCARRFEDYPSSEGFHESEDYVKYTEDIFVGYRYFETVPDKKDCVIYPFGYGLSYTTFEFSNMTAASINEKIIVSVDVKNTGRYEGKEVVQVYYGAPKGKISKAKKELCAFYKTKLLKPNETETVLLTFNISDMASYDDVGDVRKSAYVMEKGEYKIYVGNSVSDVSELEYKYILESDLVVKQLSELCSPEKLGKRMISSGEYVDIPDKKVIHKTFPCEYVCERKIPKKDEDRKMLIDVVNNEISLDDFIAQLTDEELFSLLGGKKNSGPAITGGMGGLEKYGIPKVLTSDGPVGLHLLPKTGIRTTGFPIATMLACTWNLDLMEAVGRAGAMEVKENNLSVWLTPAMNIHRSPLCGRNFEYFSEDPYVAGKMAAAEVKGIQSVNVVATLKHFACNNKERGRMKSDSIVSERALREIYLKGFEIAVKEAKPKLIMTAYNKMNGLYTSENPELITGILRGEWGYEGLVTTDWCNHAEKVSEIKAGNDIRMPFEANPEENDYSMLESLNRNEMAISVKRLLEMILWID